MLWQYLQRSEWAKINQHTLSLANVFFQVKEVKENRNLVHVQSNVRSSESVLLPKHRHAALYWEIFKTQFAIVGSMAKLLIHVRSFYTDQWLVLYQMQIWQVPPSRAALFERTGVDVSESLSYTKSAAASKEKAEREANGDGKTKRACRYSEGEGIHMFTAWSHYYPPGNCYYAGCLPRKVCFFPFPSSIQ